MHNENHCLSESILLEPEDSGKYQPETSGNIFAWNLKILLGGSILGRELPYVTFL